MFRGSRPYFSLVIGSMMLPTMWSVGVSRNGSITAVDASGTTSMSDSLMLCHPRIDDPSKPKPLWNDASFSSWVGKEQCCQRPGKSMNLMSMILIFWSLQSCKTSDGFMESPRDGPLGARSEECGSPDAGTHYTVPLVRVNESQWS